MSDPVLDEDFEARLRRLDVMRDLLYEQEGCAVGGPLHIATDDGNLSDSDLDYCRAAAERERPGVRGLARAIVEDLQMLTHGQRYSWYQRDDVQLILEARDLVVVHLQSEGQTVLRGRAEADALVAAGRGRCR